MLKWDGDDEEALPEITRTMFEALGSGWCGDYDAIGNRAWILTTADALKRSDRHQFRKFHVGIL
jgi:hypothetical protein